MNRLGLRTIVRLLLVLVLLFLIWRNFAAT